MRFCLLRVAIVTSFVPLLAAIAGCGRDNQIVRYELPKPTKVVVAQEDRMLVGIAFDKGFGWYFKLVGKLEQVNAHDEEFKDFLRSVEFPAETVDPTWTVPEGWQEIPSQSAMRAATFKIDDAKDLDLSVTRLPFRGSREEGLLLNVNRWEGQMSLKPSGLSEVKRLLHDLEQAKSEMKLLDLTGVYTASMPGSPPFANLPENDSASSIDDRNSHGETSLPEIDYELPEGWQEAPLRPFAAYTFVAKGDDELEAMITISPMNKNNVWKTNVGMWTGQVGVDALSEDQLDEQTSTVEVGGSKGKLIQLESSEDSEKPQAIVGAMVVQGDNAWFFKMRGDREQVLNERAHFDSLLKSVKFK